MNDLFDIKSVAIIGASKDPKKLGYDIVKNIQDYGFKGSIYPINLKENEILGLRVYKSITEITDTIDLAVIAIPAALVSNVLEDCVKKLIPLVIIISAGFGESGDEGMQMQLKLESIIKNTNTRLIGPNCLGIIDSKNHLNASFASSFPKEDNISFISQSGALGTAFLDWINENNLGIHKFISIGNKSDIDENYLLENLKDDKVIACYLEDIKDGKKLMDIGYEYNKKRPVIVLKPGKSEAAVKAITSHTGALTGSHSVIETGLKQSGFIEVNNIGEMFNKIKAFAWQPLPKDNKVVIVTNAGGPAVITTDLLIEKGLTLAEITDRSEKTLREYLPREANIHNPIDVVGDALSDRYEKAMKTVLEEDEVSAMIVILTPQIMTEIEKTAKIIGEMQKYKKPIIATFIGGSLVEKGMKLLSEEKIPAYHFPETAVDVLSSMVTYSAYIRKENVKVSHDDKKSDYYKKYSKDILNYYNLAKKYNLESFNPDISDKIARMYDIKTPDVFKCANVAEAMYHAKMETGFPCILKISSAHLLHKTDLGGIILDIKNNNELQIAFTKLQAVIENNKLSDATIEIQKYINTGQYLIIGAVRDQNFGTVLLVGMGGIYTEVLNDVSRRIAPVYESQIIDMINETKISKILHGMRGEKPYNIDSILNTVLAVQNLMNDYDFITSIDINPIIVDHDTSYSVDVKMLIA